MKLTESQLRKTIKESIRKALKEESDFPSMLKAIMQACNVDETEAREYLDNAAREIHSWMDQGVNPSRQTGYGGNYYEEEMQGLGLDSDYLMDFAQYCLSTYKPQEKDESTPMSEEETISVLEENENELLSPFRLYVDRQMSVIQLYYSAINKADNALQQDLARKYKQIEKELPEWCPVIVNKPRIENNPNGTQDLIIDIEYDENSAENFGEALYETKKDITMKLTESKLRKIIKESVNDVLKSGSTYDDLKQAEEILTNITKSRFIPFTSPAPSSTEEKLKDSIMSALNRVSYAIYLCEQLGYDKY